MRGDYSPRAGEFALGSVVGEPIQGSTGRAVELMLERALATGAPKEARAELERDRELLLRTEHVRRPGETILELIARTGISIVQLREWDRERIARFIAQAEENNRDAVQAPPILYAPSPKPPERIVAPTP